MFQFGYPYAGLLLLPLVAAAWLVYARRRRQAVLFAPTAFIPSARATWRTLAQLVLPVLYLAGLALLVAALARPQTRLATVTRRTHAIAIQMVVDCSGSMDALDFSSANQYRSRLDVVKETFADFIKQRPDDLIGLVTFGGYATSRMPLTIDHNALLHCLKGVTIPRPTMDLQGNLVNQEEMMTAIGDALATAAARIEKAEPKSKIIVLLSDGESNTGLIKPEEAMKAAKTLGLKVYTIGVGSNGRAPFLAQDMLGRKVVQYAEVHLDEELLKKIAQTTGGHYFNVRDTRGLERALRDIDKLEKTKIRQEVYNQYQEWFPWVLLPGLALIALAVSLNMFIIKKII